MTFDEALQRSPIKTVRVLTRGKIGVGDGKAPVASPLIIRELSDGSAKAHCTDKNNDTWRITLPPEKYQRIRRDCLKMGLYCKPMDE